MVVIVPILVFISIVIVIQALSNPKAESSEGRLQKYGQGLASKRASELAKPFSQRVLLPLFGRLIRSANSTMPENIRLKAEKRLAMAGNPYKLEAFLTATLVLGVGLPVAYLGLIQIATRAFPSATNLLVALALFAFGIYLLPNMWLNMKVSARRKKIERSLPDALDLITISVEAGLTLEAALARVVSRTKGPLAEEFSRALQEVAIGKARGKALKDVAARAGVADLQSIIAALVQGEEMGSSIAKILRVQSDSMRVKRQQHAQQMAHEAPVKMLFPLVLFILPAMFVVILGPAVIKLLDVFTKMK